MKDVVGAILIRNGRVLLTQRRPDQSYPYLWESPGGKVEPDETHASALVREMSEELDIAVLGTYHTLIWDGEFLQANGFNSDSHVFLYQTDWEGSPDPIERQLGFGWFTRSALVNLPMTPGNSHARADIMALLPWDGALRTDV